MRVTHEGQTYDLSPDGSRGWILGTVKTVAKKESERYGEEFLYDTIFPSTFAGGLKALLERMVADGLSPSAGLQEAVVTVAHLYATIGDAAREAGR